MPTTDRTIKSPIVNILTKAQYNAIATPSEDEFYLITDDSSGDNLFIATFSATGYDSTTGNLIITCDKTFTEINEAIANNIKVIGFITETYEGAGRAFRISSAVGNVSSQIIEFAFFLEPILISITIDNNNTVSLEQIAIGKTTYVIYGDGVSTSFQIPHSYRKYDVIVQVYDNSDYSTVYCDVVRTNTETITVSFAEPPASNKSYTVMMA